MKTELNTLETIKKTLPKLIKLLKLGKDRNYPNLWLQCLEGIKVVAKNLKEHWLMSMLTLIVSTMGVQIFTPVLPLILEMYPDTFGARALFLIILTLPVIIILKMLGKQNLSQPDHSKFNYLLYRNMRPVEDEALYSLVDMSQEIGIELEKYKLNTDADNNRLKILIDKNEKLTNQLEEQIQIINETNSMLQENTETIELLERGIQKYVRLLDNFCRNMVEISGGRMNYGHFEFPAGYEIYEVTYQAPHGKRKFQLLGSRGIGTTNIDPNYMDVFDLNLVIDENLDVNAPLIQEKNDYTSYVWYIEIEEFSWVMRLNVSSEILIGEDEKDRVFISELMSLLTINGLILHHSNWKEES
ncbi:hypothetical protein JCM19055_2845 [Geomicrobium sp. JCM 19055]|nr:hypothetical protein JCM19055_2845 [Geomicrobium sp. JCM 19055]